MRKAEPAWSAPTSAGGPEDKGIFTFISWAEATRGASRFSWTEKSGYSKKNLKLFAGLFVNVENTKREEHNVKE